MFFSTFPDRKFIFSYFGCGFLKSAPFLVQFWVGPLKVVQFDYKQEYKVTLKNKLQSNLDFERFGSRPNRFSNNKFEFRLRTQIRITTKPIGMCLKENYSDSPSNEYSRHYSAEYLRRQNLNSKLGEEQKKKVMKSVEVPISTQIRLKSKK